MPPLKVVRPKDEVVTVNSMLPVCEHLIKSRRTMLDMARLLSVIESLLILNDEKIQGAVVECGSYRGGNIAVMKLTAGGRKIWSFDTFEGLPPVDPVADGTGLLGRTGTMVAAEEDITRSLNMVGETREGVIVTKGDIKNTLPAKRDQVGDIALLYVDVDIYFSTKTCIENLYDQVVEGGFIYCDDYRSKWVGSKKALDEFIAERNLTVTLAPVGNDAVMWRKGVP